MIKLRIAQGLSRRARMLLMVDLLLLLLFFGVMGWLWYVLPVEGLKLHATVTTGVDLLGTRSDLLWILGLASAMVTGNIALGLLFSSQEEAAAVVLLAAAIPILTIFLGACIFILLLNRP